MDSMTPTAPMAPVNLMAPRAPMAPMTPMAPMAPMVDATKHIDLVCFGLVVRCSLLVARMLDLTRSAIEDVDGFHIQHDSIDTRRSWLPLV